MHMLKSLFCGIPAKTFRCRCAAARTSDDSGSRPMKGDSPIERMHFALFARSGIAVVVLLMVGACGPPPPRVDSGPNTRDVWGLRSDDIENCAQAMARDLIREPMLQRTDPPIRIGIAGVENQTNEPFIGGSAEMVATRIQTILFRSLRSHATPSNSAKFIMMRDSVREAMDAQRESKRMGAATHSGLKDQHGVDYILSGVYQSLDKSTAGKRLIDMYMTFSLTDAESGAIVWTNDYPIKTVTPG